MIVKTMHKKNAETYKKRDARLCVSTSIYDIIRFIRRFLPLRSPLLSGLQCSGSYSCKSPSR